MGSGGGSSVFPNRDQGGAQGIHVILRRFGTLEAGGAREQILFQGTQFGLIFHPAEVESLQVVIGGMVNEVPLDVAWKGNSEDGYQCQTSQNAAGVRDEVVPVAVRPGLKS
jgi:hypothetical protein